MIDRLIGRSPDSDKNSPFYEYYFAADLINNTPSRYLDCLAALRTIRAQLREYHAKEGLTLESFVTFVQLHRRLGTNLMVAKKSLEKEENAVNVMTAHKSKGLEFDTVFIFNGVDNVWGEKARSASRNIGYPENLPLAPAGESSDERLRLFYVAMTRAKNHLIISYSDANDSDKATLVASFLAESTLPTTDIPQITDGDIVESAELAWYEPLIDPTPDLKKLLEPQLQTYKLSPTHLNAFLDVCRGGPQSFLLDNLLHFPSSKSASASYGSAIHNTLQQAHVHLSASGQRKPIEDVLRDFEANLKNERLSPLDFTTYMQKGSEQLQAFLETSYDTFTPSQKAELSFGGQDSFLGQAHLTGSLDVVDIDKKERTIIVTDYKTGKPATGWKGKDDDEKVKLHKYRQQLLFYKVLVERSRDYSDYTVTEGRLAFIEPAKTGEIVILDATFSKEEIERFSQLVEKVWDKIIALDLPDVSKYDSSLKGILAFEQDLIDENI
jgi:DNA helicase-2/ATP-dependent DNA helicase PcrA